VLLLLLLLLLLLHGCVRVRGSEWAWFKYQLFPTPAAVLIKSLATPHSAQHGVFRFHCLLENFSFGSRCSHALQRRSAGSLLG
jgi:hypothetical protein